MNIEKDLDVQTMVSSIFEREKRYPSLAEQLVATGLLSPPQAARVFETDPTASIDVVAHLRQCYADRYAQKNTEHANRAMHSELLSMLNALSIASIGGGLYRLYRQDPLGVLGSAITWFGSVVISANIVSRPNTSVPMPPKCQVNPYAQSFTPEVMEIHPKMKQYLLDIRDQKEFPVDVAQEDLDLFADWFDSARKAYIDLIQEGSLDPNLDAELYIAEKIREVLGIDVIQIYGEGADEDLIRTHTATKILPNETAA